MCNINIKVKNISYEYEKGVTLEKIAKDLSKSYEGVITLAKINNKLKDLSTKITKDCEIKFIDTTNTDGMRVYTRTLALIFIKACEELYPQHDVTIEHSLSNGLYCEIAGGKKKFNSKEVNEVKSKINEIINNNIEIEKIVTNKENGIKIFNENKRHIKAELLKYKEYEDVRIKIIFNNLSGRQLYNSEDITLDGAEFIILIDKK